MMKLLFKKAYIFFLLLVNILSFAQSIPPPPENPNSGGIGALDEPESPIDSYTLVLFILGISIILYFKLKTIKKIYQ